ncbi:MAG TPA: universal stress protein, partial [Desulfobacterales bacterium]
MAERKTSIERILVALDASPASVSALQTAVELAARLGARLVGLFVEDMNLLRVTQLPFAREISLFSPWFRRLESGELERQLRVQA